MNFSTILKAVGAFLAHLFADEVAAATPTIKTIVDAIPADVKASKPLVALGATLQQAEPALAAASIAVAPGAILAAAVSAIGSHQS